MKKNIFKLLLAIFSITLFQSCFTNEPVLSQLYNDRVTLVLKGTYESNDPYDWKNIYTSDSVTAKSITFNNNITSQSEIKWYIDIAEFRMAKGAGYTGTDPDDYWMLFARERQVMCSETAALYDKVLDTCISDNGQGKLSSFFGEGLTLPAVDVKSGTYNHFAIYFRKLLTWPSESYTSSVFDSNLVSLFDNRYVNGTNIENLYNYKIGNTDDVVMFPLERTDLNLTIDNNEKPYVIEVRVFLKNLMMKHVIDYSSIEDKQIGFVGPSDWATDHLYNDITSLEMLGDNMIFTARSYYPDNIGSIQVTTADAANCYWAVVGAGDTFTPATELPLAATQAKQNYLIKNLPAGNYDLYKTCDTSGNGVANDGYPETATACDTNISVVAGQVTSAGGC